YPRISTALILLALLAAIAAVVMHFQDPDRPLINYQRRLVRGEAVELIGPAGSPAWSHWQTGDAGIGIDPRDGSFYIQTATLSLLDLMPDPQIQRYRFRAEVQHGSDKTHQGEVGIYFAHEKLVGLNGTANSFLALSFS